MSGLYFLLSLIGVALIAVWYVRNDRVSVGQPTTGLFRMKRQAVPESSHTNKRDGGAADKLSNLQPDSGQLPNRAE
jgi:hypothetical protein